LKEKLAAPSSAAKVPFARTAVGAGVEDAVVVRVLGEEDVGHVRGVVARARRRGRRGR
jgi:hypothetical protein